MILIFGGAYQGKLAYALERFALTEAEVYHCSEEDTAMPGNQKVIYDIDQWILALIRTGSDVAEQVKRFIEANPDAIVICDDISCGVVPIDKTFRRWREDTGRALEQLARQSEEVVRLFCGIPTRIK